MSQFLNYSELDTAIQRRMRNSAPASNIRLMAINDAVNNLYTNYDIESAIRSAVVYLIPNGEAVDISNFVSDFKSPKDLRYLASAKQREEFTWRDEDMFAIDLANGSKLNSYAISYRNGKIYLQVNTKSGYISKLIHSMSSLSDYGTWAVDAVNSDAKEIVEDGVTVLENTVNLQVDIDVSQSGNDYTLIENSSLDEIDLADYKNLGRFQFWVYIPDIADFTSVELRWGSSATDYWYSSAIKQADGSPLVNGWNKIEIDWNGASIQGTPVDTEIDYLAIKLNYGSGFTDQKVRIESISIYLPEPMQLDYFTYFVSKDSNGNYQEEMTETANDELLLPRRYKELVVLSSMMQLIPIAFGDDGKSFLNDTFGFYTAELRKLGLDVGKSIKVKENKFKLRRQW
jgi:hypothetical protein